MRFNWLVCKFEKSEIDQERTRVTQKLKKLRLKRLFTEATFGSNDGLHQITRLVLWWISFTTILDVALAKCQRATD